MLSVWEARLERFGFERLYVLLALIFGTAMLLVTPPYQVPDEPMHVFRAWQVSEGQMLCPVVPEARLLSWTFPHSFEADIPASLWDEGFMNIPANGYSREAFSRFVQKPLSVDKRIEIAIPNTGGYAPIVYAPQAVAAALGRMLGASAGEIVYLMRFGGLAFVTFCGWAALRLLPEKRLLILLLLMMPMFLFQAASASADAVVFGVCMLVTAYLVSLRSARGVFGWQILAGLLVFAILLGLLKQVYGVLLLLYFFLPVQRMGSHARFWGFGAVLLLAALATSALWLQTAVVGPGSSTSYMPGTDAAAQLQAVKADPCQFVRIFAVSCWQYGTSWLITLIGGQLGWLNVALPRWFLYLYGLMLVFAGFCGRLCWSLRQRGIAVGIFFVAAVVCIVSQYMNWTQVGAGIIEGVQGRYFIPVLFPLLAALSCCERFRYEGLLAFGVAAISGIVSLYAIYGFYYLR